MKTAVSQVPPPPPAFVPVKLEITFESQTELNAFASLANYPPVNSAMRRFGIDPLRALAEPLGAAKAVSDGDTYQTIADIMAAHPYHNRPR
jgi:hypothetical protein